MKFSLFVNAEHRPTESLQQRLKEHVEQVRLARQLGFHGVLVGDHLSYSATAWFPAFETLMRFSGEAEDMLLGTCMLVLPFYNPIHVAERFALLDNACGGRAVLGVSPGWQKGEFDVLGLDMTKRIGRFAEAVELIRRLYTEDEVTFQGKHFRADKLRLALKPARKPRPPFWFGGSVEAAVRRLAGIAETEHGDTWVASAHLKTDVIVQQALIFKEALKEAGKPAPKEFTLMRNTVVAPDRATAIREVGPAFTESYKVFGNWGLFTNVAGDAKPHPELDELINGRFVIGSPEEAAEEITRVAKATGMTNYLCRCQWVGMDHRHVMRTIELVGDKVAPLVNKALA